MTTNREGWLEREWLEKSLQNVDFAGDEWFSVEPKTYHALCRMALAALEQEACPECGRGVFMHKCTQEHHWLPKGEA